MKKIICLVMAAAASLSLFACQQTPDQAIVKGKSLDKMIQAATTTSPGASGVPTSGTLTQRIGAQPSYQTELTDKSGKLKIHVNADVSVPNADTLPVMRVEQYAFTQADVDKLRQLLIRGVNAFSGDDYKPTKNDIQQQINQLEQAIASGPPANSNVAFMQKLASAHGRPGDAYMDMLNSQLADLQKELQTAPDAEIKTPSDGKLKPFKNTTKSGVVSDSGSKLYELAKSDQAGYESFTVENYDVGGSNTVWYTSEKSAFSKIMGDFVTKESVAESEAQGEHPLLSSADIAKIPDIQITKEAAKQKADELISALGLQGLSMYSEDKEYGGSNDMTADMSTYKSSRKCIWFLRYTRGVNGIPLTYTNYDCMKVEQDNQAAPWPYEDMTFAIDDSGIVGFKWTSPYKITDTVTQNSNVMSFKDAMNVFNTMALVTNNFDAMTQGDVGMQAVDINVKHIKFGLTRITEQDKRNSGLLVPCWDFIGDIVDTQNQNGTTKTYTDAGEPILTVNAIDGSIINRSLGY